MKTKLRQLVGSDKAGNSGRKARSARGQLARKKLKEATEKVLERVGYHKMRVVDITQEAGVATSLFYHYFPDLKTIALEVLMDFVEGLEAFDKIEEGLSKGDWYGRILAHNRLYVDKYASHPGIMRCLLQVSDEVPEFDVLFRESTIRQVKSMANSIRHMFPEARLNEQDTVLFVYSVAGIAEMLLRGYYISKDSALTSKTMTNAEVAELLSVVMYRALFIENPPSDRLHYSRKLEKIRGG